MSHHHPDHWALDGKLPQKMKGQRQVTTNWLLILLKFLYFQFQLNRYLQSILKKMSIGSYLQDVHTCNPSI